MNIWMWGELKEFKELRELKTYVLALITTGASEKTIVFNSFKLLELLELLELPKKTKNKGCLATALTLTFLTNLLSTIHYSF